MNTVHDIIRRAYELLVTACFSGVYLLGQSLRLEFRAASRRHRSYLKNVRRSF